MLPKVVVRERDRWIVPTQLAKDEPKETAGEMLGDGRKRVRDLGLDAEGCEEGEVRLVLWNDGRLEVLRGRGPKVEEEAVRWTLATRLDSSLVEGRGWEEFEGSDEVGSVEGPVLIDLDPKEAEERDRWMR